MNELSRAGQKIRKNAGIKEKSIGYHRNCDLWRMEKFELKGEYIQLLQLIKVMRWMNTGGEGKYLVDEGLIRLNGEVESRYRAKLKPGDIIEFDGQKVKIV